MIRPERILIDEKHSVPNERGRGKKQTTAVLRRGGHPNHPGRQTKVRSRRGIIFYATYAAATRAHTTRDGSGDTRLCRPLGRRRALVDTLLEREQLLRAERLVVDLRGRLDEVLQVRPVTACASVMCTKTTRAREQGEGRGGEDVCGKKDVPGEEVAEVHELAVGLVLDVDDAPAVLAAPDGLAVDDDVALGANDGEGDQALLRL